jgi:hypothetical protein
MYISELTNIMDISLFLMGESEGLGIIMEEGKYPKSLLRILVHYKLE